MNTPLRHSNSILLFIFTLFIASTSSVARADSDEYVVSGHPMDLLFKRPFARLKSSRAAKSKKQVPLGKKALKLFQSGAIQAPPPPPSVDLGPVASDVARIKALIPATVDFAGEFRREYDSKTDQDKFVKYDGDDYLKAAAHSFVKGDFNKDGKEDFAVAVEAAPANGDFGDRTLMIFLSRASGEPTLYLKSSKVLMRADDGGLFGDPFDGMTVNAKGTISISHYGGSADRWGFVQRFQFRNDDFYLIGYETTGLNTNSMTGSTEDTNYLTGDKVVTEMRGDRPDVKTTKNVGKKPLKKLSETQVGF